MDFGAKGPAQLAGIARELDDGSPGAYFYLSETLRCEPLRNGLNISVRRTVGKAKLLGREPAVITAGKLILLIVEKLQKCGVLLWAALQEQQHTRERLRISDSA